MITQSRSMTDRMIIAGTQRLAALAPARAAGYEPVQARAARTFVLDLLDAPEKHIDHAKRWVLSPPSARSLPALTNVARMRLMRACAGLW